MLALVAAITPLFVQLSAEPPDQPEARPVPAKPDNPAPAPELIIPPVPFPHPLITEILYAVPTGPEGDASGDGMRHVAGDEFIELINPHDKPIQLLGYTITDRNPPGKGQLRFTFPALELPPNGVAVLFNGCEQSWGVSEAGGPTIVGDSRRAPDKANDKFHGAFVFSARVQSSRVSWANGGDFALLSDPSGRPIHCVTWGTFKEPTPAAALVEQAPATGRCSVQRRAVNDIFVEHVDLPGAAEPAPFSPGLFKPARPGAAPGAPPDGAATPGKPPPDTSAPAQRPKPLEIKPPPPKHKP